MLCKAASDTLEDYEDQGACCAHQAGAVLTDSCQHPRTETFPEKVLSAFIDGTHEKGVSPTSTAAPASQALGNVTSVEGGPLPSGEDEK